MTKMQTLTTFAAEAIVAILLYTLLTVLAIAAVIGGFTAILAVFAGPLSLLLGTPTPNDIVASGIAFTMTIASTTILVCLGFHTLRIGHILFWRICDVINPQNTRDTV